MEPKLLLIDDEWKEKPDIIGEFEQEGFYVKAFESHEEGIEHLKQNLHSYVAVILDAKVKNKKDDTHANLIGLTASRDYLEKLNETQYLPYFIYTAQPDGYDWVTFEQLYGDYYVKGTDNEQLFADIRDRIENKKEYILRRKYNVPFEVCTDRYIGDEAAKTLMNALVIMEYGPLPTNFEELLTPIRKVGERLFGGFNKLGFLPDEVLKGQGWINKSGSFLMGEHSSYRLRNPILSPVISFLLRSFLAITQDVSHTDTPGTLKLKADAHLREFPTPYLYSVAVFQLLEILIWFKRFADENPDVAKNKSRWEATSESEDEWIRGEVSKIAPNGFGTFVSIDGSHSISIPPAMVSKYELVAKQPIEIKVRPDPTGTKKYVKEIRNTI